MKHHLSFFDFLTQKKSSSNSFETFAVAKARPTKVQKLSKREATNALQGNSKWTGDALQGRSSMTGFKKAIYNRVKLSNNLLSPAYNRRKYNHSHYNQIEKQCTRLSRTYGYLSRKKITHFISSSLVNKYNHNFDSFFKSQTLTHDRTSVKMLQLLESQLCVLMYRSLFSKSIPMARQQLRQSARSRFAVHATQNTKMLLPGQLYQTVL